MPEVAVAEPEVQQEPLAPASDAPETEAPPAAAPESPPEPEGEAAAPLDFDDDTVSTILELGGDKLFEAPAVRDRIEREAQSLADQRIAEIESTPDHNAQYVEYQQQLEGARYARAEAVDQLAPLLQALANGDETDPKQIAGLTVRAVQAAQAAEQAAMGAVHTQHRVNVETVIRGLFDDKAGLVIGKFKSGKPMSIGDAYDNAMRAYDSQLHAVDDQGQPDWQTRQNAGPELVKRAIHMARSAGLVEGHQYGMTAAQKKAAAGDAAKTNATINEIAARAAAKRLGQTAPVLGGQGADSGPLTVEEASTLPISELIRRTQAQ